jgi:hypothetical protein
MHEIHRTPHCPPPFPIYRKTMLPLQNHFDVAHLLGHPAMQHLSRACTAYRAIHEESLGNPEMYPWHNCLRYGMRVQALRRIELESCVQAVVLFQAAMEKMPYFVPDIGGGLNAPTNRSFDASWRELIQQISDATDQTTANSEFDTYKTDIYIQMRNPIIHGRKSSDIAAVNAIRIPDVHRGMRAGWRAYDFLLKEVLKVVGQTHGPSWEKMCSLSGVPENLDLKLYPDLAGLSQQYFKRHLDGADAPSLQDA